MKTKRNQMGCGRTRRSGLLGLIAASLLLAVSTLSAATHYVSLGSTNPVPPYTNWITAATNIQDAVDAASSGDTVLVNDGVYAQGQKVTRLFLYGETSTSTNRVAVTIPIALRSVNGPQFTLIDGGGAMRCVLLVDGASLTGFTLTNGYCYPPAWGGGVHCESTKASLTNCTLTANRAHRGGGAGGGTLYNCALRGNSACWNAPIMGSGGGGGATRSTLYNCTVSGNTSVATGGGVHDCELHNCLLSGNSAWEGGGGANKSRLYNCTLIANSTSRNTYYSHGISSGGGASGCALNDCILQYNTALSGVNYDSSCTLNYCCTTPLPSAGAGNIAVAPQLASLGHLSVGSPCRGAGSAVYVTGTDIDGEPWADPPSMGCDQYRQGEVTGPLTVSLRADYTNFAAAFPAAFTAWIEGRTTGSVWDFGDGEVATNQPVVTHAWRQPGDYRVSLWAFNENHQEGVSGTLEVHVGPAVHYVATGNTNPVSPYTSWACAATNIQEALDVAGNGALVLVSDGTYASGERRSAERETNRVVVERSITLRSLNGPQFTVIDGGGAVRCAWVDDGTLLSGFTLRNGRAGNGGGVWCNSLGVISNCVVTGNSATCGGGACYGTILNSVLLGNSAEHGGGATYWSVLKNCALTGNSAGYGGGAEGGTLNNCTLAGNLANDGGGASYSTLNNCIIFYNSARIEGANYLGGTLNYCCTTPLPEGTGNLIKAPSFVNMNGWADLRLQSNSPCINAGNNAFAYGDTDLDGNPRIAGATVDIGAYEFQGQGLSGFSAWLWQYGQPIDGSANAADPDQDRLNNQQEWVCATCPTNSQSALRLLSPATAGTNLVVTWSSVAGVNYYLERSTNLASPFSLLATNLVGQEGFTSYEDPNTTGGGPFFYRVGVTCR